MCALHRSTAAFADVESFFTELEKLMKDHNS